MTALAPQGGLCTPGGHVLLHLCAPTVQTAMAAVLAGCARASPAHGRTPGCGVGFWRWVGRACGAAATAADATAWRAVLTQFRGGVAAHWCGGALVCWKRAPQAECAMGGHPAC